MYICYIDETTDEKNWILFSGLLVPHSTRKGLVSDFQDLIKRFVSGNGGAKSWKAVRKKLKPQREVFSEVVSLLDKRKCVVFCSLLFDERKATVAGNGKFSEINVRDLSSEAIRYLIQRVALHLKNTGEDCQFVCDNITIKPTPAKGTRLGRSFAEISEQYSRWWKDPGCFWPGSATNRSLSLESLGFEECLYFAADDYCVGIQIIDFVANCLNQAIKDLLEKEIDCSQQGRAKGCKLLKMIARTFLPPKNSETPEQGWWKKSVAIFPKESPSAATIAEAFDKALMQGP